MTTTHTPGEWELVDIAISDDRTKQQIVANGRGVMMISHDGSDEGEANARLIVAAPELLESLKEIIGLAEEAVEMRRDSDGEQDQEMIPHHWQSIETANAAIARATGQQ